MRLVPLLASAAVVIGTAGPAIAASAYCPEKLTQTEDQGPAPKPTGA